MFTYTYTYIYSKPKHTAACFRRTEWQNNNNTNANAPHTGNNKNDAEVSPAYHLVGHKAPVVAVCFSPVTLKPDSRLLVQMRKEMAEEKRNERKNNSDSIDITNDDDNNDIGDKLKSQDDKKHFSDNDDTDPLPEYCHCVALCSQDQRISIWLTAMHRPLLTIKKPFTNAMVDMAWSHTGRELIVCSLDGSICR